LDLGTGGVLWSFLPIATATTTTTSQGRQEPLLLVFIVAIGIAIVYD
jgi:hypothetical protein